ncbi:MAG: helix-turn-helix domain-containing protein, partial [Planctomycetota bacterium]
RETISRMQAAGQSRAQIASALGRHRSTVYREINRNAVGGVYRAVSAHRISLERRKHRALVGKMFQPEIREQVVKHLIKYWSPEQIAGRIKVGGAGSDRIIGGHGHDRLFGRDGWDRLYGGHGNDYLDGGYDTQTDYIQGDEGRDTFVRHRSVFGSPIGGDWFADTTSIDRIITDWHW